ncbi:MAG: preprotein translocase subunit SecG [Planctomycetes bacterium]|nr:preprotein translocase subunit SecG [Planctomycetota bacterium]
MNQIFEWFANNPWATALLMVLFIAVSTLMVLAILIQRPQGGGLSAAFGGGSAGSGQTAFGTKTGDALTWFTISVFAAFLLFGMLLNYATTPAAPTVQPAAASGAAPTSEGQGPANSGGAGETGATAPAGGASAPVTPAPVTPAPATEPAAPSPGTTPVPSNPAPATPPSEPAPK